MQIYIDGVASDATPPSLSGSILDSDIQLMIGGLDSSQVTHGYVDELKIYPYSRSESEIKADYQNNASAVLGIKDESYLSNGLVGYWKMDESDWTNDCTATDVADSSGNDNNGKSCPSTTGPDPAAGKFGNGGSFDGSNDYIEVPDSTTTNVTGSQLTVAGWYYFDTVSGRNTHLIRKYNSSGGYVVNLGTSGNVGFYIYNGVTYVPSGSSAVPADQWTHVVGTYDNNQNLVRLYINGTLVSSANADGDISSSSGGNLLLGYQGWQASDNYTLDGSMDEVRIYNRALSPAEIRQLYNWAPRPSAYWKMDESSWNNDCSTDTVFDSSSNGNDTVSCPNTTGPTGGATGKFGKAGYFDGSNDYIYNSSPSFTFGDKLTISAWLYPTTINGDNRQWIASQNDTFMSYLDDASSSLYFRLNAGGITTWDTGYDMVLDTWQYVTLVYDGENMSAYVDGAYQDSNPKSGSLASSTWTSIGADYGDGSVNDWYQGKLDDVRIYNYARTPAQIIEDMNAGHPIGGSPLGSQAVYYKFDEGYGTAVQDSSPNNYDGTNNGTVTRSNQGKFNKAVDFDGSSGFVRIDNEPLTFSSRNRTISLWYQPDASDISSGLHDIVTGHHTGSYDYSRLRLYIDGATDKITFYFSVYPGPTAVSITTTSTFSAGEWYHLAVTWDETDYYLFVNGVQEGTYSHSGVTTDTITVITLGSNQDTGDPATYLYGAIDEFKVYYTALTQEQVKLDKNHGASQVFGYTSTDSSGNPDFSSDREYCVPGDATSCSAPIAELKFDENTGTSTKDTSENSNTGTLTNGPVWKHAGNCKYGSCLSFDGASGLDQDDYVIAGSDTSIDNIFNGGGTASFWLYPESAGESDLGRLLSKRIIGSGWDIFTQTCDSNRIDLFFLTDTAATDGQWRADCVLNLNQWNYIAITYDDDNTANDPIFYVNGIKKTLDYEQNGATYVSDASNNLYIGAGNVSGSYYTTDGLLDTIRLYDYIRTPAQVAWDYGRGAPVAHWRIDECQGDTIYDVSENGNDGTITIGGTGSQDGIGTCTDEDSTNARYNGRSGKYEASLNFDGTDDYVTITDPPELDFGTDIDFTITYWFKTGG
ncbi:MAG: LamG-like jellyroll fold domain-containing protein, partial [Candidatus Hodarchaeales archaeon]